MPEFHQRVAVLQQLGYLEADKTVTMKGRGERRWGRLCNRVAQR